MPIDKDNIPESLKGIAQWVCWKEQERNGDKTKVPVNPATGKFAKANDPDTWATFDDAFEHYESEDDVAGIGFMFSEDGLYTGVDLDKCRDPETGDIEDEFEDILETLDSYTEVSPSGTGMHVIVIGMLPPDGGNRKDRVEMYDQNRFFTFTGDRLEDYPATVEKRVKEIKEIHSEHIETTEKAELPASETDDSGGSPGGLKPKQPDPDDLSDRKLIEKAMNAENGNTFKSLWNGSASGYKSHSEADMALCGLLAFWTGGNEQRIDSLFRQSGLMRPKWKNRQDYRIRTIQQAVAGQTEFYKPDNPYEMSSAIEEQLKADNDDIDVARIGNSKDFVNVLPEDHFVTHYINHAASRTDAYDEYHFANAMALLSLAADRHAVINVSPTQKYPNMWFLLLGDSTVSRKSTSMKIAESVMEHSRLDHKRLPDDFSPQALISELEDRSQSVFFKDEFGQFLADMNRSYNSGMDAVLSKMYDCPETYERKLRKESFTITNAYLTMIGACVPDQVVRHVGVDQLESGFFPRMAVIYPERPRELMRMGNLSEDVKLKAELIGEWMSEIYDGLNFAFQTNSNEPVEFKVSEDALKVFNDWNEEFEKFLQNAEVSPSFGAFVGRGRDMVLKMACLFELGTAEMRPVLKDVIKNQGKDQNEREDTLSLLPELVISEEAVRAAAYYVVEYFLPFSQKMIQDVYSDGDTGSLSTVYNRAIEKASNRHDGRVNHSDLLRASKLKSRDFNEAISTLVQAHMMKVEQSDKGATYYIPLDPDGMSDLPSVEPPSRNWGSNLNHPDDDGASGSSAPERETGSKDTDDIDSKIIKIVSENDGIGERDIQDRIGEQGANVMDRIYELERSGDLHRNHAGVFESDK